MDIYGCAFDKCLVSLLRILFGGVAEEAGANSATDTVIVFSRRNNVVFVSMAELSDS